MGETYWGVKSVVFYIITNDLALEKSFLNDFADNELKGAYYRIIDHLLIVL